ncbi:MAG TPA: hypothetical protein VNE42_01765 [Acidimicrobiales bacterium]|nr:hypothetical protein [Acidimicrobiales bacterium]
MAVREVMLLLKAAAGFTGSCVAIVVSASLLVTSCNRFAAVSNTSTPPCIVPHGSGPGYDAAIGNQQNDKSVCITIGERLLVVLSAGATNASKWRAIHVSRSGILHIAPLTLMFSRGTTGTNFKATDVGTVELTAQRPACAPALSAITCDTIEIWRASIIVRAPPKPSGTGIYGSVMAGPTCPVERAGQPCPPKPVAAVVDVRNVDGVMAASTHTDRAGRYAVSVRPGRYVVLVITGAIYPRCPNDAVTVPSGSRLRADISCDTGIR